MPSHDPQDLIRHEIGEIEAVLDRATIRDYEGGDVILGNYILYFHGHRNKRLNCPKIFYDFA